MWVGSGWSGPSKMDSILENVPIFYENSMDNLRNLERQRHYNFEVIFSGNNTRRFSKRPMDLAFYLAKYYNTEEIKRIRAYDENGEA